MEGRAMSSVLVKCLSEKFCLSLSLLHALSCHFCLCPGASAPHKKTQLPLCSVFPFQGAQTTEFTQDAFMFVQKSSGPFFLFYGGQGGGRQVCSCLSPDRFFLPLLHLQHLPTAGLEQAGAQCSHVEREREGNLVQNPPVYECV